MIGDFLDDHLNDENGFVGRRRDNGKLRVLVVVVLTRVNLVAIELLAFKIAFCRPLSSLVLGIRQVHLTKKKKISQVSAPSVFMVQVTNVTIISYIEDF